MMRIGQPKTTAYRICLKEFYDDSFLDDLLANYNRSPIGMSPQSASQTRSVFLRQIFPGNSALQQVAEVWIPANIPLRIDLRSNILSAKALPSIFEFRRAVGNKGPWDYKQQDPLFQEFGNWHYGVVARARGYSRNFAQIAAGYAQEIAGTSKPEWNSPRTGFPWGDDPLDQIQIILGWEFADRFLSDDVDK